MTTISPSADAVAPVAAASLPGPQGRVVHRDGERWFEVAAVERMAPFFLTLTSDRDHWCFVTSTGALTAGRGDPDHALFPYTTQDKLLDQAGTNGSVTLIRGRLADGRMVVWRPYAPAGFAAPSIRRTLRKSEWGHALELEEAHPELGLRYRVRWQPGARFGFLRKVTLVNETDATVAVDVLDGLQNILCPGLISRFQEGFSILGDAYKMASLGPAGQVTAFNLSATPSDGAMPMEALRAHVVWSLGWPEADLTLDVEAPTQFARGEAPASLTSVRGRRLSWCRHGPLTLAPGEARSWTVVADVDYRLGQALELDTRVADGEITPATLAAEGARTATALRTMLATADGLQATADERTVLRHTSNTLFNLMRGGVFAHGYAFPMADLERHLRHHAPRAVPAPGASLPRDAYAAIATDLGEATRQRLVREYLPLTFSRRHGDPSRPWNRFSIALTAPDGAPRYAYEGNWRDIFQNWEALLHSFPGFLPAAVRRFLNASTADGYNPYRITKDGIAWEEPAPDEPWANIGYWGDHQIVYLLRLLEAHERFWPGQLATVLPLREGVYTQVPYQLVPYTAMRADPRNTIRYDDDLAAAIRDRVATAGEEGKLLPGPDNAPWTVTLLEKLLVPALAKIGSYVPGGGIWMNTQRPEWNDANNALVGYGVSVVTAGYLYRYLDFLERILDKAGDTLASPAVTSSVATLLQAQTTALQHVGPDVDAAGRAALLEALGESATEYRQSLYTGAFAGDQTVLSAEAIRAWLEVCRSHLAATLKAARRDDDLYESYVLLAPQKGGIGLRSLYPMLEGQVSVLASGALADDEVNALLAALPRSELYRPDQQSYLLYPNRSRPTFWEKNRVPAAAVAAIPGVGAAAGEGATRVLVPLPDGDFAFHPDAANSVELAALIDAEGQPELWDATRRQAVLALYEEVFAHHAFTGRSGTFFAYEGLGSIYWHMVSKLALAVQELALEAHRRGDGAQARNLASAWRELHAGLGIHKPVTQHGAIPTDAYSHTPENAGAQQPGMTGQVKEDWLARMQGLGVHVIDGTVVFDAWLVTAAELLDAPVPWSFPALPDGAELTLTVPARGLAFSFCQVPVIYRFAAEVDAITVERTDGTEHTMPGHRLPAELAATIFRRTGEIRALHVTFSCQPA